MREQVQRLDKRHSVATQQGQLTTGVTGSVSMPYVQQQKTSGQRLAETLGMLVEGGTKIAGQIVANKDKEKDTVDAIEFRALASEQAAKDIQEIEQLPVYEREKAYRQKLSDNIEKLKTQYKNNTISDTAFTTYVNTMSNTYQPYSTKSLQTMQQLVVDKNIDMVKQSFFDTSDYSTLNVSSISNNYGLKQSEIGKLWSDAQTEKVQKAVYDKTMTPEQGIKALEASHKSMVTKDNPNVWKSAVYIDAFNTAKASLLTQASTAHTAYTKKMDELYDNNTGIIESQLLTATTKEQKDAIILNATNQAVKGSIRPTDLVKILKLNTEKSTDVNPEKMLNDAQLTVLEVAALNDSDVNAVTVGELRMTNYIDQEMYDRIMVNVKARQAVEEKIKNEGKSDSYKAANKLIAEVTANNPFNPNVKLKQASSALMYEYTQALMRGDDPYTTAKALIDQNPVFKKEIDTGNSDLETAAPEVALHKKYGINSLAASELKKVGLTLKTDAVKSAEYRKSIHNLYKQKKISYDDYQDIVLTLAIKKQGN